MKVILVSISTKGLKDERSSTPFWRRKIRRVTNAVGGGLIITTLMNIS